MQKESITALAAAFPPTFLFGMERSGTTLLSMMIGAHPQIAVPLATTGMWIDFAGRLHAFNHLARRDDVIRLVDEIRAHERIALWDAALDRTSLLEDLPLGDYGAVVAKFHAEYARAKGKPHWANVDIATLDSMDLVNSWFPDARFLHIIRDGRDVALSHQTMPYGAGNITECARAWAVRTTTNAKMGRILGSRRYLTIRFEDLVLDTHVSLSRICDFLGVQFDDSMLRYGDMVKDKIPESRRWLWPSISRPPEEAKVDQWRRRMTRSQRIVFEGQANKALKAWSYQAYERIPKSAAAYFLDLWYYLIQGGRLRRLRRRVGLETSSLLERRAKQSKRDGFVSSNPLECQKRSFDSLVDSGVYSTNFDHGAPAKTFVAEVLRKAVSRRPWQGPLNVLDCGCGTGAWLDFIHQQLPLAGYGAQRLCGFDLSQRMVDVARQRLRGLATEFDIRPGNVLEAHSYAFDGLERGFDLIFTYDVVQQLPHARQIDACFRMADALAPGGIALIFDNDAETRFGRRMALLKFVTRYFGLKLVPRYYCNAVYPPLERFRRRITQSASLKADIAVRADSIKRALIVERGISEAVSGETAASAIQGQMS